MPGRVTLFIPGLLQAFSVRSQPTPPALPSLDRLLARADRLPRSTKSKDKDQVLAGLFGAQLPEPFPAAALSWIGDGQEPTTRPCLRADPVHLHPDRDRLLLFDARHLDITDTEADALARSLNEHLQPLGMVLDAPDPERWYLHLEQTPALQTTPLDQATGRDVLRHLPGGNDGPKWRTLLNELQMLLHQHPINEQREAQALPTINSLWFWGNGEAPPAFESPFTRVWTTDPITRGLARLSNTPTEKLPRDTLQWLTDVGTESTSLIQWDPVHQAQTLADPVAWSEALQQLEKDWLIPLIQALKDTRLAGLSLVTGDGHEYRVTRRGLRRWWRRDKPWSGNS
jgi:hypothetical protein